MADVGRVADPQHGVVDDRRCRPSWDVKTGKNVKWVAELGSQTYGNPAVGSGVVIIGTNNEARPRSEAGAATAAW